jgi:PAS domain S-box-containing protein
MSLIESREAISTPNFSEADIVILKKYFEFNKRYYNKVNEELTARLADHPLWGALIKLYTPEQTRTNQERSLEMQRAAIYEGKWEEYSNELITQGRTYARMNVKYEDWYDIIRMYKVYLLPYIKIDFAHSVSDAVDFIDGLSKFLDYAMYGIAEAYFQEKNAIIKEKEERFRAIFENSADYIYLLDNKGYIQMINRVAPGMEKEDVVGKCIYDVQDKSNGSVARDAVNAVFAQGEPVRYETQTHLSVGRRFFSSTASPVFNKEGIVESVVVISHDITEKKEAEQAMRDINTTLEIKVQERTEELKKINKELESFSYSVSHDLRGPLRAINGFTQILSEEIPADVNEEAKDAMREIVSNASKMAKLIDSLLEFSRLGKQHVSKTTVDMDELFKSVINDLKRSKGGKEASFKIKPLGQTEGDHAMLKQVAVNLVSNAIKYSSKKPSPEIEIGYSVKDDQSVYYVKDNGAGFDMAYYDKLFGVFQRLHGMDEFEGTGVGLAIVQRIISKHSGKVWAEGKVDQGAIFSFSLPNN